MWSYQRNRSKLDQGIESPKKASISARMGEEQNTKSSHVFEAAERGNECSSSLAANSMSLNKSPFVWHCGPDLPDDLQQRRDVGPFTCKRRSDRRLCLREGYSDIGGLERWSVICPITGKPSVECYLQDKDKKYAQILKLTQYNPDSADAVPTLPSHPETFGRRSLL